MTDVPIRCLYIPYNDVIDIVDRELKRVEYVPKDEAYYEGYRHALRITRQFVISRLGQSEEMRNEQR